MSLTRAAVPKCKKFEQIFIISKKHHSSLGEKKKFEKILPSCSDFLYKYYE